MKKQVNREFCRMQKLAGIIIESELHNFDPVRYIRNTLKPFEAQKLIDDVKEGGDGVWNYFTNLESEDEVRSFIQSFYI
jgi:hypothetical protein